MTEQDIGVLVEQLRSFRSRSGAISELIAAGDAAVGPLIEALGSETQEGAVWAILRCLSELRARQAVANIARLLGESRHRAAAHGALVRIVGQDLGPTADAWLRWVRQAAGPGAEVAVPDAEMHMTGLEDDRLIELALRGCGASWHREGSEQLLIEMPLKGGGSQQVTVNMVMKDHEGSPIVIVHADCGPPSAEHYEYALRQNLRMPYGALAIRDAAGGPRLVMFNTLLRDALSPLELRKSILTVGEHASRVRRDLEG